MGAPVEALADTPTTWVLVFRRTTTKWWLRPLPRYKHVAAYAYVPGARLWLFYEVGTTPTSIVALKDGQHLAMMAAFIADADLVAMRRNPVARVRLVRRLAFTCVTAMRDLIGLDSGAFFPSGLWRDCLRAGGKTMSTAPVRCSQDAAA